MSDTEHDNHGEPYPPDRPNPDGELGLSVDPDIFTAPGAGDLPADSTATPAREANMFYTQGGTPC
jgi:hypothetical protein